MEEAKNEAINWVFYNISDDIPAGALITGKRYIPAIARIIKNNGEEEWVLGHYDKSIGETAFVVNDEVESLTENVKLLCVNQDAGYIPHWIELEDGIIPEQSDEYVLVDKIGEFYIGRKSHIEYDDYIPGGISTETTKNFVFAMDGNRYEENKYEALVLKKLEKKKANEEDIPQDLVMVTKVKNNDIKIIPEGVTPDETRSEDMTLLESVSLDENIIVYQGQEGMKEQGRGSNSGVIVVIDEKVKLGEEVFKKEKEKVEDIVVVNVQENQEKVLLDEKIENKEGLEKKEDLLGKEDLQEKENKEENKPDIEGIVVKEEVAVIKAQNEDNPTVKNELNKEVGQIEPELGLDNAGGVLTTAEQQQKSTEQVHESTEEPFETEIKLKKEPKRAQNQQDHSHHDKKFSVSRTKGKTNLSPSKPNENAITTTTTAGITLETSDKTQADIKPKDDYATITAHSPTLKETIIEETKQDNTVVKEQVIIVQEVTMNPQPSDESITKEPEQQHQAEAEQREEKEQVIIVQESTMNPQPFYEPIIKESEEQYQVEAEQQYQVEAEQRGEKEEVIIVQEVTMNPQISHETITITIEAEQQHQVEAEQREEIPHGSIIEGDNEPHQEDRAMSATKKPSHHAVVTTHHPHHDIPIHHHYEGELIATTIPTETDQASLEDKPHGNEGLPEQSTQNESQITHETSSKEIEEEEKKKEQEQQQEQQEDDHHDDKPNEEEDQDTVMISKNDKKSVRSEKTKKSSVKLRPPAPNDPKHPGSTTTTTPIVGVAQGTKTPVSTTTTTTTTGQINKVAPPVSTITTTTTTSIGQNSNTKTPASNIHNDAKIPVSSTHTDAKTSSITNQDVKAPTSTTTPIHIQPNSAHSTHTTTTTKPDVIATTTTTTVTAIPQKPEAGNTQSKTKTTQNLPIVTNASINANVNITAITTGPNTQKVEDSPSKANTTTNITAPQQQPQEQPVDEYLGAPVEVVNLADLPPEKERDCNCNLI